MQGQPEMDGGRKCERLHILKREAARGEREKDVDVDRT